MSKFLGVSYKVIIGILMVFFLGITVTCFSYGLDQDLSPVIVILGTIITFLIFKYLNKKLTKLSDKKINIIALILSVLFFVGVLLIGIFLPISSVTDLSHIIEYVNRMFSENSLTITGSYFSKYTNQIPLLIIVYGFAKIGSLFGITNVLLMGTIFNALFISLTAYFIYLIGKEIHSPKAGLLSLLFMVINPIFYLYASYFYTDTLCMPMAVIGLYFLIKCLKSDPNKKKFVLAILAGIFFYIGLKIRIIVAILLIAAFIFIFLNRVLTKKMLVGLGLIIGLILGGISYQVAYNQFNIEIDKNAEFPITHWLMMGLNEEYAGGYNNLDHDITFNETTTEDKIAKNLEVIKTRLNELGLLGLLRLEGNKISRTWASGNYGVFAKLNNTSNGVGLYEYLGGYGNKTIFLEYSLQILKAYISLIILIGLLEKFKKKPEYNYDDIVYIALFGAITFYLIWEAAQRYSLSFLPWMIIPLGVVYNSPIKVNSSHLKTILNNSKLKQIGSITLMFITLILLTINFAKYTLKENTYNDIVILSYRGFSEIVIEDEPVSQTFTTSNSFNQVRVRLNNKDEDSNSVYTFMLINDDTGEVLYTETFNSSTISNGSNKRFYFDPVIPEENTCYRIVITKEEGSSLLSIGTYNESKYYKSYNNGSVYIGSKEQADTFIFRVESVKTRTFMSIPGYLLLSIIILGGEFVSLKTYIFSPKKEAKGLA